MSDQPEGFIEEGIAEITDISDGLRAGDHMITWKFKNGNAYRSYCDTIKKPKIGHKYHGYVFDMDGTHVFMEKKRLVGLVNNAISARKI